MGNLNVIENQKECMGCFECCKWMTFVLAISKRQHADFREFYESRGCRVYLAEDDQDHSDPSVVKLVIMVPSVCPQLTSLGCKIYKHRPYYCSVYDGRNDPLMKDYCRLPK